MKRIYWLAVVLCAAFVVSFTALLGATRSQTPIRWRQNGRSGIGVSSASEDDRPSKNVANNTEAPAVENVNYRTPLLSEAEHYCRMPEHCYSSRCYALPSDIHCLPNPYHRNRSVEMQARSEAFHSKPGAVKETVCRGQPKPSPLPYSLEQLATKLKDSKKPSAASSPDEKEEEELKIFQSLTGQQFSNWYDWSGNCVPTYDTASTFTAQHERGTGIYRLKNFCLRPTGKLSGYRPDIQNFEGTDDVETWTFDQNPLRHVRQFLTEVEPLDRPPKCFYDTKLLLMPSFLRCDNPGHVFMRKAALLDIAKQAFPGSSPSDLTTAFLFLEELNDDLPMERHVDLSVWGNTAFPDFTTVVTGSHFGVYALGAMKHAVRRIFGPILRSTEGKRALQRSICFKEAALFMTATHEESKLSNQGKMPRDIIPLFFTRSGVLLKNFVNRMKDCAGDRSTRAVVPSMKRPVILLSVRSRTRRLSTAPELVAEMGRYVTDILGGTLLVHEMSESDIIDLVDLHRNVDILVSLYGAGLFFGIFMKEGSVVVEINWQPKRSSEWQGINHVGNRWSDYGGNLLAVGVHHIVITFPGIAAPPATVWMDWVPFQQEIIFSEFNLSPHVVRTGANAAMCLMRSKILPPETGGCESILAPAGAIQKEHNEDTTGELLRQYCRLHAPHAVDSRLPWIFSHAQSVAEKLRSSRLNAWKLWNAKNPPEPLNRILVLAECGLTAGVAAEVKVLLHYYSLNVVVTVYIPPSATVPSPVRTRCADRRTQKVTHRQFVIILDSLDKCVSFQCERFAYDNGLRRHLLFVSEEPSERKAWAQLGSNHVEHPPSESKYDAVLATAGSSLPKRSGTDLSSQIIWARQLVV